MVSNRADRHRRGRPTPAAPVVDEFDAFDEDELLYVLVDYHRSPVGAWAAILVPDGLEPVALQATSAHDAFHKATEFIEVLSEHADVAISTMHTLDGDPVAWATLAAREGFVDCAMSDNTLAALITQNRRGRLGPAEDEVSALQVNGARPPPAPSSRPVVADILATRS